MTKKSFVILGVAGLTIGLAVAGGLMANEPARIGASVDGPFASGTLPTDLPAVPKLPMNVDTSIEALSTLSFDDGTCEAGLGVGAATDLEYLVNFDVPTVCTTAGLEIRGVSVRANTVTASGVIDEFVLHQATATPNPVSVGADTAVPVAALVSQGACPAPAAFQTRAIATGAAVVNNTVAFFAGMRGGGGFLGRDQSTAGAGRIWLTCPICGMTQYSAADISAITTLAPAGNWNLRVTVEDVNCVPVELMGFGVS